MSGPRLTHVGGPTLLVEIGGWRLLTDPTFDPPGRRYAFGWGTSSRKVAGPAVEIDALGRLDAVLLTHDHHGDNLDDSGRRLLHSVDRVLTTTPGARRLGGRATGLETWSTTTLEAPGRSTIEVTATPCRHGPPLSRPLTGAVAGFALRPTEQDHGALWISGDTVLHPALRDVARRIRVDTAVLHLGGVRFPITGPLRYTMTARDAVELARLMRPRTILPVHYEGWQHFREDRRAAEAEFARAPAEIRERVRWLPLGEPVELTTGGQDPTAPTWTS